MKLQTFIFKAYTVFSSNLKYVDSVLFKSEQK